MGATGPVVLLVHGDHLQELLHPLILSLGQPVSLGVEGCPHVLSHSQSSAQRFSEVQGESGVSIQDDFI